MEERKPQLERKKRFRKTQFDGNERIRMWNNFEERKEINSMFVFFPVFQILGKYEK